MPVKSRELDAIVRLGLGERDSKLVQVLAQDGIRAVQIVRGWDDLAKGPPSSSMASLIARLEQNADAGRALDTTSAGLGAQGLRRYVANPYVGDAQFDGFWVGGPLQIGDAYDEGRGVRNRGLRQTLTLVHAAGHTLGVDEDGCVTSADGSTADALKALKAMRPLYRVGGATEDAWGRELPDGDFVEIAWKHFTHESEKWLNALTPAQVSEAVGAFASGLRDWKPTEWHFAIDPDTNAGVWTVKAVAKDALEPASAADLAGLPHEEQPAERRRVRIFGLAHERGGEGLEYSVTWVWKDILRDRQSVVQFVREEGFATLCMGAASNTPWKVADTKVDRQDDGLLRLTVEFRRVDFRNRTESVKTDGSNEGGWGASRRDLIPSVATAEAPGVAENAPVPAGHVAGRRSVSETSHGYADVTVDSERVWKYTNGDKPPNLPVYKGIEAPDIEWVPDRCAGGGGYRATYHRVAPDQATVDSVIAKAVAAVTPAGSGALLKSVRVSQAEGGSVTVSAQSATAKVYAGFGSLVSSDYFTSVYRREYDNLDISASGTVTDETGAAVRIVDALGNVVPTVNTSGSSDLLRPGVVVSAQYQRDADCKWHVVVTTEVAAAREWEYEYETRRGGHPETIRVRVWRNQPARPAPPASPHGSSAGYSDQINRFGLHDGQAEISPDIHAETSRAVSDSATEHTERVERRHVSGESASANAGRGEAVSKTVTTHSDNLQDVTETRERGKPAVTKMSWTERRSGHTVSVRKEVHQNSDGMPAVSASGNERVGASASVNRFGLVDAQVQAETDVWARRQVEERETAFEKIVRETVHADGSGDHSASGGDGGPLAYGSDTAYSDGRHDTTRVTVTPKPVHWIWEWDHRYRAAKSGGVARAIGHGYRNQREQQHPRAPAGGKDYVYSRHERWTPNEFGLWDGSVTFEPVHFADADNIELWGDYVEARKRPEWRRTADGDEKRTVWTASRHTFHTNATAAQNQSRHMPGWPHNAGTAPSGVEDEATDSDVRCVRHATRRSSPVWEAVATRVWYGEWGAVSQSQGGSSS